MLASSQVAEHAPPTHELLPPSPPLLPPSAPLPLSSSPCRPPGPHAAITTINTNAIRALMRGTLNRAFVTLEQIYNNAPSQQLDCTFRALVGPRSRCVRSAHRYPTDNCALRKIGRRWSFVIERALHLENLARLALGVRESRQSVVRRTFVLLVIASNRTARPTDPIVVRP